MLHFLFLWKLPKIFARDHLYCLQFIVCVNLCCQTFICWSSSRNNISFYYTNTTFLWNELLLGQSLLPLLLFFFVFCEKCTPEDVAATVCKETLVTVFASQKFPLLLSWLHFYKPSFASAKKKETVSNSSIFS